MSEVDRQRKKARRDDRPNKSRLLSLLTRLSGGNPLDLASIAAIAADGSLASNANNDLYHEQISASIQTLFTIHVGESPQVIIGNAIRCAEEEQLRERDIFDKKRRQSGYSSYERGKWLNHPVHNNIYGPVTEGKVWLEMILGEERAAELLEKCIRTNRNAQLLERVVVGALKNEALELPTTNLLENILTYAEKVASTDDMTIHGLFRFSALYGLDGMMNDILKGNYGEWEECPKLTINTLLPSDLEPLDGDGAIGSRFDPKKMWFPAYAISAILGHRNVVTCALKRLGGEMDVTIGLQVQGDPENQFELLKKESLLSHIFIWVFMKNMPEMITYLVNECGFQFRWIDHICHTPMIFRRLFDAAEYESFPKWTGDLDEDDLLWEDGSTRCLMRATAAYKEQMKMLDLLIELGLPFELLFPVDPEKGIQKFETRGGSAACSKILSKKEKKDLAETRECLRNACASYNSLKTNEAERLTLVDYYAKLKSRWNGQGRVQAVCLSEYEALDSRVRKARNNEHEDY